MFNFYDDACQRNCPISTQGAASSSCRLMGLTRIFGAKFEVMVDDFGQAPGQHCSWMQVLSYPILEYGQEDSNDLPELILETVPRTTCYCASAFWELNSSCILHRLCQHVEVAC